MGGLSDEVFVFGENDETRAETIDQRAELLEKAYGERSPLPDSPAVEDWPTMTLECRKCRGEGECRHCLRRSKWTTFFPLSCRHCDGTGLCVHCSGDGRRPNPDWYGA